MRIGNGGGSVARGMNREKKKEKEKEEKERNVWRMMKTRRSNEEIRNEYARSCKNISSEFYYLAATKSRADMERPYA